MKTRALGYLKCATATAIVVGVASVGYSQSVYNAGSLFSANETNPATQTNSSFSQFVAGYGNTISGDQNPPSALTPYSAAQFNASFATDPNTAGFNFRNGFQIPATLVNTSTTATGFSGLAPQEILLHPGGLDANGGAAPIQDAVLRFIAPSAGTYTITGSFRALAGGTRVEEIGLLPAGTTTGGTSLFSNANTGTGAGTAPTPFSLVETLNPGDMIDFAVSQGSGGINSNSTGLIATITATPEPTSLALLGLTGMMLLRRRRA